MIRSGGCQATREGEGSCRGVINLCARQQISVAVKAANNKDGAVIQQCGSVVCPGRIEAPGGEGSRCWVILYISALARAWPLMS
jgi:hypothetical protein